MRVKFGAEEGTEGPLLRAKFHPHRCNVSPLRGEKPQNRPLSKLDTARLALRAMLPVINARATILLKTLFSSVYSVIIYIENVTDGKVTN